MRQRGFTIVELLIVIVVIGILAGIVAFYYPGYQERARNNQRQSDLSQLSSALKAYALQKNNYVDASSGCGLNGQGNGWINASTTDNSSYPRSIAQCLDDAKVLPPGDIIDPSGCKLDSAADSRCTVPHVQAYMKATCTKNGSPQTILFAYLEGQPSKDSDIAGLCDSNTVAGFSGAPGNWATMYGMNYYVIVH